MNRFAMHPVNIMVIAPFWRTMSGFMAVNVGLRIPGIQTQLKPLLSCLISWLFFGAKKEKEMA